MSQLQSEVFERWRAGLLALVAWLLVGCVAHSPAEEWAVLASASHAEDRASGGARMLAGTGESVGATRGAHEQEARRRALRLEEARVQEWVLAASQEGRGAEANETAREAEAERALSQVLGLASGMVEIGKTLAFTFWVERGALTLLDYREEGGSGRVGRPVKREALTRELRPVFSAYVGRRARGHLTLAPGPPCMPTSPGLCFPSSTLEERPMAGRDPYRRVYGTEPLRRVGGGQDRFDKEAHEGPVESPISSVREQRQMDAPLNPGRKSFAARLERLATPPKKK